MEKEKSYNKVILEVLGTRPVAFNPVLAEIVKSASAGLFMSQLLYWWNKGKNEGWIYKTIDEVKKETTLSREEQDTAIRKWKELGVLEIKVIGVPPKRHFRIDIDKLTDLVKNYVSICGKDTN